MLLLITLLPRVSSVSPIHRSGNGVKETLHIRLKDTDSAVSNPQIVTISVISHRPMRRLRCCLSVSRCPGSSEPCARCRGCHGGHAACSRCSPGLSRASPRPHSMLSRCRVFMIALSRACPAVATCHSLNIVELFWSIT